MAGNLTPYDHESRYIIGDILRLMRQTRNVTQTELSEKLAEKFARDCSASQISRFENGSTRQPSEYILEVCAVLDFHPITFSLCSLHNNKHWWETAIGVDSGKYIYHVIAGAYHAFGHDLMLLKHEDFDTAATLCQSFFKSRIDQVKGDHVVITNERQRQENPYAARLGFSHW